jgi:hypothetical protein
MELLAQPKAIQGHLEKFNYERELVHETHVPTEPSPIRLSGLRQFFNVHSSIK